MSYKSFMIVYQKSQIREENFEKIKWKFKNNLEKFKAIDCINEYPKWKQFALKNTYCSTEYIQNEVEKVSTGKLGCNLSHQILLENILQKYQKNINTSDINTSDINTNNSVDWFLILEDDVGIKGDYQQINSFLENLVKNLENFNKARDISKKTRYVQLCIYNQFYANQVKTPKLFGDTFVKIPQFGTCAYLIHIDAIKFLCNMRPWTQNIDFIYNSLDRQFNSVATFNPYFYCQGTTHANDNSNQNYGSIIWENKKIN